MIAATKTGTEKNATVFARYWVEALHDPTADIDKNEAISALEAFQYADRKTAAFYDSQKRLATEHAVFEDTGKGEPVRAAVDRQRRGPACFRISRSCAWAPRRRPRTIRPSANCSPRKKSSKQKIDTLKYQKAAMAAGRLQEAAHRRAGRTGARAGGAGQVTRALARIRAACARSLLAARAQAVVVPRATPDDCHTLRKHGHRAEAQACYQSLTQARDPYLRAEGYWGLEMYDEANNEFRAAVAQSDNNAHVPRPLGPPAARALQQHRRRGSFQGSLEARSQKRAGLSRPRARQRRRLRHKAVEWDDQSARARSEARGSARTDGQSRARRFRHRSSAVKQADEAIELSPDALDAMAIHAAVELLADRSPDAWLDKIRQVNPTYGEGYALVAHHLVLNRRYEDGVAYYRKAIEADPQLWSAHSELGINLMRLGQEDEPRQQLEMCYNNGYRDAATVNSLRLLDSYKNFVTFKDDTTILKLHKNEADLLRPYFEEVLKRAIATYEKKYKMKLPGPVQVEVYPDHEDFAVRTLGMPGLGALGVTFGEVVAMDSPSGRKPGDFNWASTLWHEMSHVYILTATNHRVPRWFTEGLAVHEETRSRSRMGRPHHAGHPRRHRDKKLLPVADSTAASSVPSIRAQVIVSYYQAGRICDYIQSRWGADKLLDMVHSFAQAQNHARGDPAESRHVARGVRQAVPGLAQQAMSARRPRISTSGATS